MRNAVDGKVSLKSCTGCGACTVLCPKHAVSMVEDGDGFMRPFVDAGKCVNCGLCVARCPAIHPFTRQKWVGVRYYAAQLVDRSLLKEVSSGGAFWALASAVIGHGGVVYGAAQESVDVVRHVRAETLYELEALRRSKYLPSQASHCFKLVRQDLKNGREVLFSGTGCQVAGLMTFLGEAYPKLLTVEVVCHGIPSLSVWRRFRKERERAKGSSITRVVFRDKSRGWKDNSYRIEYSNGKVQVEASRTQAFHAGYLQGLFYRESCASCPFASLPRIADITLADFWKYKGRFLRGGEGVSLIAVNTPTGAAALDATRDHMNWERVPDVAAVASCRHLTHAPKEDPARSLFLKAVACEGYKSAFRRYEKRRGLSIGRRLVALFRGMKRALVSRCLRRSWRKSPQTVDLVRQEAMIEAFLLLAKKGVSVFVFNRVGLEKLAGWEYPLSAKRRMAGKVGFPVMREHPDIYENELRELFGERYSREYVQGVGAIPRMVDVGGLCRHEDAPGPLVTVVGGRRLTVGQPAGATRTLHMYGRCGVFGYAVEDADTLPSQVQALLTESGITDIRVENHGLWGGDEGRIDDLFLHDVAGFREGDVVVFYRKHPKYEVLARWEQAGVRYRDVTHDWHAAAGSDAGRYFFDKPGHLTAEGYAIVAKEIVDELRLREFKSFSVAENRLQRLSTKSLVAHLKGLSEVGRNKELDDYLSTIVSRYQPTGKSGAIVMNCNPFTFGHRYLIETAAAQVDRLFVFVVQEDKSVFRFADRLEMVESATADLKNVVVMPSGRFMISALTFPEYFLKDQVKENGFDVSADVVLFAEQIAPRLGITKRFAGTEPSDPVTDKYNQTMREILPRNGISFIEIPRKENANGVISATAVRRLLTAGDWQGLSELVPMSTLRILRERYAKGCGR